jgi:hypothetical protein
VAGGHPHWSVVGRVPKKAAEGSALVDHIFGGSDIRAADDGPKPRARKDVAYLNNIGSHNSTIGIEMRGNELTVSQSLVRNLFDDVYYNPNFGKHFSTASDSAGGDCPDVWQPEEHVRVSAYRRKTVLKLLC